MAQCPAGHNMEEAFHSLRCRACARQCIIRYLINEVVNLRYEINNLKRDM